MEDTPVFPSLNANEPLEWLKQFMNLKSFDSNRFMKDYFTNINHLIRINQTELIETLSNIEITTIRNLRKNLSLFYLENAKSIKSDVLILKNNKKPMTLALDIYYLTHLIANPENFNLEIIQLVYKNASSQSNDQKTTDQNVEDDEGIWEIFIELQDVNMIAKESNRLIKELQEENKSLKQTVSSILEKMSVMQSFFEKFAISNSNNNVKIASVEAISANGSNNQNIIIQNKDNRTHQSTDKSVVGRNLNQKEVPQINPNPIKSFSKLFSNTPRNEITNNSSKSLTPSGKRKINEDNNKLVNRTDNQNKKIKTFNSYENSENIPVVDDNAGYQPARQDKIKIKRAINFAKKVGLQHDNDFKVSARHFSVYLGRVDVSMNQSHVEAMLNARNITFFKIEELVVGHKYYKAFCISINYLDKDIIKDKKQWPRGLVVGRYYNPKKREESNGDIILLKNPTSNQINSSNQVNVTSTTTIQNNKSTTSSQSGIQSN